MIIPAILVAGAALLWAAERIGRALGYRGER
mgnify:CR=1 FL=1